MNFKQVPSQFWCHWSGISTLRITVLSLLNGSHFVALLLICFHLAVLYNQQLTILDYLGLLLYLISLNIVNNISLIRDNFHILHCGWAYWHMYFFPRQTFASINFRLSRYETKETTEIIEKKNPPSEGIIIIVILTLYLMLVLMTFWSIATKCTNWSTDDVYHLKSVNNFLFSLSLLFSTPITYSVSSSLKSVWSQNWV